MRARFIWRALRARFRDQAPELAMIRSHIRPGDLVCDVGANKGSYLYWMSRWAGRVVAFEPQPELARYLETACETLGMRNVIVERAGVSDATGEARLFVPSTNSPEASLIAHGTTDFIPIRRVRLDDYFPAEQRIALLKIDVEGAEFQVFRGAERILRAQKPVLLFECEQRHLQDESVIDGFDYLHALGYEGWFFLNGRQVGVSQFDPCVHQLPSGDRFWTQPGYCNNFLFVPAR